MPVYDPADLAGRMGFCFTLGELRAFAAKLQVPRPETWANGHAASGEIVKHFQRSGALAFLVEELRLAKPYAEWPDPVAPEVPPAPPPEQAPSTQGLDFADTELAADGALGQTALLQGDDRITPVGETPAHLLARSTGSQIPPPVATPAPPPAKLGATVAFAPQVLPKPGDPSPPRVAATVIDAAPAPATQEVGAPQSRPAVAKTEFAAPLSFPGTVPPKTTEDARPAWPGMAPAAEPKKQMDRRIWIGVGVGILTLCLGLAFFLGRSSAKDTSTPTGEPAPEHVPLAESAVNVMVDALARVAKSCGIPVGTLHGRSLLEVIHERCGKPPAPIPPVLPIPQILTDPRPPSVPVPTPDDDSDLAPDPIPPKPGAANPRPKTNTGPKTQPDPSPPSPSPGNCMSGCDRSHAQCKKGCGPEPKSANEYGGWQNCLSACLVAQSQCRRTCR